MDLNPDSWSSEPFSLSEPGDPSKGQWLGKDALFLLSRPQFHLLIFFKLNAQFSKVPLHDLSLLFPADFH